MCLFCLSRDVALLPYIIQRNKERDRHGLDRCFVTLTWSTFSSSSRAALLAATSSFIFATLAAFSSGVSGITCSVLSLNSLWPVCVLKTKSREGVTHRVGALDAASQYK